MGHLPLNNKVCIVTGASSGIGEAITKCLSIKGGAKVLALARRFDRLQVLKKSIEDQGGNIVIAKCDITNLDEVEAAVNETIKAFGTVDILVNNAGMGNMTMMKHCKIDQWHKEIDVNCKGTMNVIGTVLPVMIKNKSGHIVTITSEAGKKAFPGLAVYSGTKFFLEGMLSGLRQEMVEYGIKVASVQPGDVATEFIDYSSDQEVKDMYEEAWKKGVLSSDMIADAVLFTLNQPDICAVNELMIQAKHSPT